MSGRVVDSDYVKPGEILPVSFVALTEQNNPTENSAQIQAEYLERRKMRGLASEQPEMMKPTSEPHLYGGRGRSPSPPPSRVGKERVGMSKALSGFLERLPSKEQEKREEQDRPFPARGHKKGHLGVPVGEKKAHNYPAKSADALRKDVLSLSLFPNLYNRSTLLRGM